MARAVAQLPRLVLRGLMTLPDPSPDFASELAVHQRAAALFAHTASALQLPAFDTLSMGMTGDLEAAVQAGSTMVRIGTAIFGHR